MDIKNIVKKFQNCECGEEHKCDIKDIKIGSGIIVNVGEILKQNNFPNNILLMADENTIEAAKGIRESLKDFNIHEKIYKYLRVATMEEVEHIEEYIKTGIEGIISVGTGSLHDTARLACARNKIPLCLVATAPSMDGFASYSAPIVNNNFKITYPAKSPEIIIGDTRILAKAPRELKSAGFGDMMAKYVALVDWQVSHLVSGEKYCKKVAELTRYATDMVFNMAKFVMADDENSAGKIFEGLLLTGIAMSFTKTSRPGSGTEHIMAHFWECLELMEGKIPNYHGKDVGVSTLIILKFYKKLSNIKNIKAHKEIINWDKIYKIYGNLSPEIKKLNTPDTITDNINPENLEKNWGIICEIINSVPSYKQVLDAMELAGCAISIKDIGKSKEFVEKSFIYHPFMRRRLSLLRLSHMIEGFENYKSY